MKGIFSKSAIFGFLMLLLLAMNIGGVISASMMAMENGSMISCPYMDMPALCDMSPLEHLSQWQSMISATPQQLFTAVLLLLLTLTVLWRFFGHLFVHRRIELLLPRFRYRERIFNPLQLAFARGIIHTKVF